MEVLRPMDDADQPEVSGQRIKALYEVIRESHAIFDSTLVELELDPPIACKSGCIHCCYNQVALTEPEALFLGLHLLETRDRQNLQDLKARTLSLVNSLKGKSWQAIGLERHRLPCLFLEDGNCSIYPARPLACRGWNSVDEEMCRRSNQSENAMTLIENHPAQRLIADSIQRGLLDGSKELGLEAGFMLMARAVLLFLEDDAENRLFDCTGDWLSGRPFFNRKRD
jgi:Fe-S-cluster containining protein